MLVLLEEALWCSSSSFLSLVPERCKEGEMDLGSDPDIKPRGLVADSRTRAELVARTRLGYLTAICSLEWDFDLVDAVMSHPVKSSFPVCCARNSIDLPSILVSAAASCYSKGDCDHMLCLVRTTLGKPRS